MGGRVAVSWNQQSAWKLEQRESYKDIAFVDRFDNAFQDHLEWYDFAPAGVYTRNVVYTEVL